jgi:hypothetical protein
MNGHDREDSPSPPPHGFDIGGWNYGDYDVDVTTLVPPTLIHVGETNAADGTFEGEVRYNNYTARCVLAEPANVNAHASLPNDFVHVGPHAFSRTRYRACCNPVFVTWEAQTYVLINTDLNTLTLYHADTGAEIIKKIRAPEMMVGIYMDAHDPLLLHLFGWFWSPIEEYTKLHIRTLFTPS